MKREERRERKEDARITVGDLSNKTLYGFKGEKKVFLLKSQGFFYMKNFK